MSRSRTASTRAQTGALDLARLWCEAGAVIALRLWGLGGRDEHRRMIDDEAPAYARAFLAAWQASALAAWWAPYDPLRAAFAGTEAWTCSLSRKTRANRTRLTRGAPRPPAHTVPRSRP